MGHPGSSGPWHRNSGNRWLKAGSKYCIVCFDHIRFLRADTWYEIRGIVQILEHDLEYHSTSIIPPPELSMWGRTHTELNGGENKWSRR